MDDAGWDRHLSEAMVAVQLRASTNGEFSGAVAEALAAEILGLLSDPGRRKGLSEAARAYAVSVSFESVAEELYGLLITSLNAGPR